MAAQTLNGKSILGGSAKFNVRGNWTADCELDGDTAPEVGSPARIVWGSVTLLGTVQTAGASHGRISAHVVGGAGGLNKTIAARAYGGRSTCSPQHVLADIVADAGEQLDPASPSLSASNLAQWLRVESSAQKALDDLADQVGADWHVTPDGKVFFGPTTWTPSTEQVQESQDDKGRGRVVVFPKGLTIFPGMVVGGRQIRSVKYDISGAPRAELTYGDTQRSAVAAGLGTILPSTIHRETHPAEVIAANPDGTIDVLCDNPKIGELTGVPMASSVPGAALVPDVGDRVRVFLDEGSPASYRCTSFDTADPLLATMGVARVGDAVDLGWLLLTAPAGGGPVTVAPASASTPGAVHLMGAIVTGSSRVKLLP